MVIQLNRSIAFGCLTVILMGQLYAWWLVVAWKDFKFLLLATIALVEILHLSLYSRELWRKEVKDYIVVILTLVVTVSLDGPLRQFGGLKGYFVGVTIQHLVFFFLVPRWIQRSVGTNIPHVICSGLYCAFHAPNIPLLVITLFTGILFALCYQKWRANIFPLMIFLHYIGGSLLKAIFHLNMRVGIVYVQ